MEWRLAKSLETLRAQVDALAPHRSKGSDGSIGDAAHASRSSDHNPYIKVGGVGIVRAIDITHDPAGGFDSYAFADMLRANADKRIRYIISNRRIANPGQPWRKYSGANPHDHHVHVSVSESQSRFDDAASWDIDLSADIPAVLRDTASPKPEKPLLKHGSKGDAVERLQALLHIAVDGDFGPKTETALKAFQKSRGLVADGKCGFYTWRALEAA